MDENGIYKECYSEMSEVNRRLTHLATVQAIAHCVSIVLIIGMIVGFYFFSDYGYGIGTSNQIQNQGTSQTQSIKTGGDMNG